MMPPEQFEVIRASFRDRPAAGPALARHLLDQVAGGQRPATLRLARPGRAVAFGRRDVVSPGYRAAAAEAVRSGHPGIERISGGRATAYTSETLVLGFTVPAREPARQTTGRFEWASRVVADSLIALGADALVGEIEGEYCPGRYSVNLGGRTKVAGLGQRMIPGAAHLGVVLTVGGAEEVRATLTPVYRDLGIAWRPETAGAVSERIPGATLDDVEDAILGRLRRDSDLIDHQLDAESRAAALSSASRFTSPGGATSDPDPGREG